MRIGIVWWSVPKLHSAIRHPEKGPGLRHTAPPGPAGQEDRPPLAVAAG